MAMFLLLTLLTGVPEGGTLYVKSQKVKLHAQPNLKSSGRLLKKGEPVVWRGTSTKDPDMNEITVQGKHGFVATTDLTPFAPESLGPEVFKSSGRPRGDRFQACRAPDAATGRAESVDQQLEALRASSVDEASRAFEPMREVKR
jgi:hypothetical protein